MTKSLHLSAIVALPDNMFERAGVVAGIQKPWQDLLAALNSGGLKPESKCEEMETRAKAAPGTRKPRTVRAPVVGESGT